MDTKSGLNLNWSGHRNETPYFLDFGICDCDAPVCPVHMTQRKTKPCEAVLNTVDHDCTARIDSIIVCPVPISSVGIGNMQSKVKPALHVLLINQVISLGRFMIALMVFWPCWPSTECDSISSENLPLRQQGHSGHQKMQCQVIAN